MDSDTDQNLTGEGPGIQPGGIARQVPITDQPSEGPGMKPGGITGSVGSGKGVKRKRNLQTYDVRYKAIIEVEKGTKKKDVAAKFGVPANTLSTWIKNKEEIKKKFLEADVGPQRKRDKKAKYPELESALIQWFSNARAQNIPISGEVVKEKSRQYAQQLDIEDFECSTGWLDRFKDRHNLAFKKVCGESKSVDTASEAMSDWKIKLASLLKEFSPEDIYNADETGLFFRMLPDKTLEFKDISCHGSKMSKDRLTVMVFTNMAGTDKVPLLVIGKSKNPRCFKNVATLPTQYEANKTAWVTSEIFTNWVKKLDRKIHSQGRKIALIVDNCPAHPEIAGLRSVTLIFLPPNTTSVTQPMDQGVIRNLKSHYRKMVITRRLREMETSSDFRISVLDALQMLKTAWRMVKEETIVNCYRHAGFEQPNVTAETTQEVDDPEDDIPLAALIKLGTRTSFQEFVNVDENLPVCAELTDAEILDGIINKRGSASNEEDEEPNEEDDIPRQKRSITEAMNCLDVVMDFLSQQGIGPETERAQAQTSDLSALFNRHYLQGHSLKQTGIQAFLVRHEDR